MDPYLYKNESALLLACSRIRETPQSKTLIDNALRKGISWKNLISIANKQEITPFLYYSLKAESYQELIPADIMDTLRNIYMRNLQRNLMLQREMSAPLKECNARDIPVLFFKGLPLSFDLYPDPGLRYMTDVDLIVKRPNIEKTVEIFKKCGFSFMGKYAQEQRTAYAHHYEIAMQKKTGLNSICYVEIHSVLIPARPYPLTLAIWDRAKKWPINDQMAYTLSDEDAFLICFLHMRKHIRRMTLKNIVDISEFLNAKAAQLDWGYIEQAIKDNHMKSCVYLGLSMAHTLLNNEIARHYIPRVRPGAWKRLILSFCINRNVFFKKSLVRRIMLRAMLFDQWLDIWIYFWQVVIREKLTLKLQKQKLES
jgi:hypothetical protein